MKKLFSTLLVVMITATLAFAQVVVTPVSSYFVITNKTTQETRSISLNDFTKFMDVYMGTIQKRFNLGFYGGDQIEVKYDGVLGLSQLTCYYSVNNGPAVKIPEIGQIATFSIPDVTYDNQSFVIKCDYKNELSDPNASPTSYYITLQDIRNDTRFYSEYSSFDHLLRITYNRYNEVRSYLSKPPYVTVTNVSSGVTVFRGDMNDNGQITFSTGGKTGTVIVSVTVDGVTLPSEKTYLY